ncbi:MAG: PepSY domain-containing protein [Gallionellaceae bacterium]|nr:PepSY domain-containing protein [Gallionellaceae bacterium]
MKRKIYLATLAILSAAAIGSAYASKSTENDALAIIGAKINLSQAVTAAEQHVGGKATRAEYERHKGQWVFEVEVVKDKQVMDVKVDPMSGKVLAAVVDKSDRDHDRDHED